MSLIYCRGFQAGAALLQPSYPAIASLSLQAHVRREAYRVLGPSALTTIIRSISVQEAEGFRAVSFAADQEISGASGLRDPLTFQVLDRLDHSQISDCVVPIICSCNPAIATASPNPSPRALCSWS